MALDQTKILNMADHNGSTLEVLKGNVILLVVPELTGVKKIAVPKQYTQI